MTTAFDRKQIAFFAGNISRRRTDHPAVAAFARQRIQYVSTLLRGWKPATALDVGCGDGVGMRYMQDLVGRMYGCDRSATMLRANQAPPGRLTQCDAANLPYPDDQFELVYCWEVLHHIENPLPVVREMSRVARHAVLLCEPNCLNPAMALFGILHPAERGLLRFTPSFTQQLMTAAGLADAHTVTGGSVTPNRMPTSVARVLSRMPYRIPVVGMSTIGLGLKSELAQIWDAR